MKNNDNNSKQQKEQSKTTWNNNWNLHARTGRSPRPHPLPLLILHLMSYVLKFPLNLGFMIHIYDLITIHLLRLASFQISNRPLPSQAIQEPKSPGKHRSRQPWSSFVISCQSEQRFGHSDVEWVCSLDTFRWTSWTISPATVWTFWTA